MMPRFRAWLKEVTTRSVTKAIDPQKMGKAEVLVWPMLSKIGRLGMSKLSKCLSFCHLCSSHPTSQQYYTLDPSVHYCL